jgi:hypothetical protein
MSNSTPISKQYMCEPLTKPDLSPEELDWLDLYDKMRPLQRKFALLIVALVVDGKLDLKNPKVGAQITKFAKFLATCEPVEAPQVA